MNDSRNIFPTIKAAGFMAGSFYGKKFMLFYFFP